LAYETAETQSFRWKGYGTLWYSARGLIRHPLAYPFISVFAVKGPFPTFWFGPAIGLFFTPVRKMHLNLCEIRDIGDEIERRMGVGSAALAPRAPHR
jgi:hypothetical protein